MPSCISVCVAVLVVSISQCRLLVGDVLVMSKSISIDKLLSKKELTKGDSMMLQSSPIYVPSMVCNIEDWLTLLQRVSRVSPSRSPDAGSVRQTHETYGRKSGDALARFDPKSCSWRTFTGWLSGMEGSQHTLGASLLTLPPWVTWDEQALYQLETLELPTCERDGGAWGTPSGMGHPGTADWLANRGKLWETPRAGLTGLKTQPDGRYKPGLKTQAALWATPRAHDAKMSPGELMRHDGLNKEAYLFGHQAPQTPLPGNESCGTDQTLPLPLEES